MKAIPKPLLRRYFTAENGEYKIVKSIRDLCLFSRHDVTSEPPFGRLDMISCRNLLIYFAPALQKRVMSIFQYALKPDGILWLGGSETPGVSTHLFQAIDENHRIYQKKGEGVAVPPEFPLSSEDVRIRRLEQSLQIRDDDIQKEVDHVAALRFAPCGVVVTDDLEVIRVRGRTSSYLEIPPGKASHSILNLARIEIAAEIRRLIRNAKATGTSQRSEHVRFEREGRPHEVNIEVIPIYARVPKERRYIIFFEKPVHARKSKKEFDHPEAPAPETRAGVALTKENNRLKNEISALKEQQDILLHDREIAQQEHVSANEHVHSMNLELQNANEALSATTEELQSTVEELTTVNDELQIRNRDLNVLTNDMINFIASAEIPIVMVDGKHCIRRFTPGMTKLMKLVQSDIGRPIRDIKSSLDIIDLDSMISEALEVLVLKEVEVRDRDGHWYGMQVRPYRTSENKIDGAVLAFLDIHALKQAYQSLQIIEEKYRVLLESAYDAVVVTDAEGCINIVNKQTEAWFGYLRSELIGQPVEVLIPSRLHEAHVRQRKIYSQNPVSRTMGAGGELYGQRKDGTLFPVEVSLSPVQTSEGLRVIAMVRDVSGRKKLEDDRKALLVREREAREVAEMGNRAKDLFIATLSHELRTPLTSILSWAQMLKDGTLDTEKSKKGIEIIEASAVSQRQMINDLLDVSRILMGKLTIERQHLDIRTVLSSAIDVIRPNAEKKRIAIHVNMDQAPAFVHADPARLKQVFWNIMDNAIKFSPEGGKVSVRQTRVDDPKGGKIRVEIQDSGSGIKREFIPHLFDRFFQADSSSIRSHGGLGIGLAIVRSLLDMVGGEAEAKSEGEGKGSVFVITLPFASPPGIQTENEKAAAAAESAERPNLSGLRVLIVEDDTDTRELLEILLSSFGAKVTAAASAAEGYQQFLKSKPGILVSDIAMPGEDGYSLIAKVRALPPDRGGDVPAIALTAYAGVEDRDRTLRSGFQVHMAKPVDNLKLAAMVQRVAGNGRTAPNRAAHPRPGGSVG